MSDWRLSKPLPPRLTWVVPARVSYTIHGEQQRQERGFGHYEVLACIDRPDETDWTTQNGGRAVCAKRGDIEVVYDPRTLDVITVTDLNSHIRKGRPLSPRTPMVPTQAQETSYLLGTMLYQVDEHLDPVTQEALKLATAASKDHPASAVPLLVEVPPAASKKEEKPVPHAARTTKDGREIRPRMRNTPVRVAGLQECWDKFISRRGPDDRFTTSDWYSFAAATMFEVPKGTIINMTYRAEQIGQIYNVARGVWAVAHPVTTSNGYRPAHSRAGIVHQLYMDFMDQLPAGAEFTASNWKDYLTGSLDEVKESHIYGKLGFQVGKTIERLDFGQYRKLGHVTEGNVEELSQPQDDREAQVLVDAILAEESGAGITFVDYLPGQEPQVTDFAKAMELVLELPEVTGALSELAKDPGRRFGLVTTVVIKGHRNVQVQIVRHPTEPDVYHLYARATDMEAGA